MEKTLKNDGWVTVAEFKKLFPLLARQVYNLVHVKDFPASKKTGRWLIYVPDVTPWLKRK